MCCTAMRSCASLLLHAAHLGMYWCPSLPSTISSCRIWAAHFSASYCCLAELPLICVLCSADGFNRVVYLPLSCFNCLHICCIVCCDSHSVHSVRNASCVCPALCHCTLFSVSCLHPSQRCSGGCGELITASGGAGASGGGASDLVSTKRRPGPLLHNCLYNASVAATGPAFIESR